MDTLFAMETSGKPSQGHSFYYLLVTDKVFVYVVAMNLKGDVLQAIEQFYKEIGTPEAIVCDAAGEKKSNNLRKFCRDIIMNLRVLEEGTLWGNKAELYISLIKEEVRKDTKESDCPITLGIFCGSTSEDQRHNGERSIPVACIQHAYSTNWIRRGHLQSFSV